MTDEKMIAFASGMAITLMRDWLPPDALEDVLEPEGYFDECQDAVCIAQQVIAEATGLVGLPDV